MAGEMHESEVTREAFPDLFKLRDALKRRGIESTPRPFDQYQGPVLRVPWVGSVWYANGDFSFPAFLIENHHGGFYVEGAGIVVDQTKTSWAHGVYTLRQAARAIADLHRSAVAS